MSRILVIDDNEHVRETLCFLLSTGGFEVEAAANGQEGLQLAHRRHPDLILCDLNMPGMDGFETIGHVRSDPELQSVPIIVISGSVSEADEWRAKSCGADAFLVKPFSLRPLMDLVAEHLNHARAHSIPAVQNIS